MLRDIVRQRAPDDSDPLVLLETAITVAAEAGQEADALVEHYVAAARAAGCSWTVIGERLGVSKQAAREKYMHRLAAADVLGEAAALVPRLAACLEVAKVAADEDDSVPSTHHLLLGLLHAGLAATVLDHCGVTREQVRTASARLFEPAVVGGQRVVGDGDADTAVLRARRLAGQAGQQQVGTEHLLSVLVLDAGSSAHRVLADIGVDPGRVKKELAHILPVAPRSRRRRGRGSVDIPGRNCSFCGCSDPLRPMVNGPGVVICEECVQLSAGILRDQRANVTTG